MLGDSQVPLAGGGESLPSLIAGGEAAIVAPGNLTEKLEGLAHAPQCELLGEFGGFGWWLQGILGILSFSSLLIKRWQESPQRPLKVFIFDTLKQVTGSGALHMMNLLCASLLATFLSQDSDPCEWYWLNIMVDTTLGVYVLHLVVEWSKKYLKLHGRNAFGYYGNPPSWRACLRQVLVWQAMVSVMKFLMVVVMILGQQPLAWAAGALLKSLDDQPHAKLVVVMIITPLTMNSLQYWVTDNIIKLQGTGHRVESTERPHSRSTYHPVDALASGDDESRPACQDICLEQKA
ncbi:hypothetical protein BESB_025550 [Besnoitia besnoiti]|uniref:Transmembrane protein n=1 Tax=Besnoitia besnoiti TaxID=94643 RepID=A0A2A9M5K0_BESBE|nr:uncharacterized protein BESB_025550 [Besnoitia besnoiti]PFH31581.1 hypothetical protein BESB_025550 [Besnoitia besnoiti]